MDETTNTTGNDAQTVKEETDTLTPPLGYSKFCYKAAQEEAARLPLRSDTTPRRLQLCKRCETQLRSANFFMKRQESNRGRTVTGCDICHCRTYCGVFDVQGKRERDS